ncbi:MAG: lipopolysaccharide heptosyltransferase I [Anaerolineae bacterium]|nr:lipopolysaccharide heptosyltransferase I [Phycisphaerae bacterium]
MSLIDPATPPRRILLIKPSALGDIVHALPVLNLLKRRWPDAEISWLIGSSFAGLLDGHPQLHEVIRFDRHRFAQAWWNPRAMVQMLRFIIGLRRRQFDLVIDLQGLLRSGLTAKLARSPIRMGFSNAREMAWMFYTHRVPAAADQHALDRNLQVAEALGCGRSPVEFVLPVDEADREFVHEMLPADQPYAVLLPGTNWLTKRWPVEYFAALVGPLKQRYNFTSVVAGGSDAAELAPRINGALDLTSRTNLKQLVALLAGAELVIANDSGPMHIAAALGRPLVTMFGPTNPMRTGPWGHDDSVVNVDIQCSPCYSRKCSHISCMKWLGPEAVLRIAHEQIEKNRAFRRTGFQPVLA